MEISIERSPQHSCPNKGSNSECFDHKNDSVTAPPHLHLYICKISASSLVQPAFSQICGYYVIINFTRIISIESIVTWV